MSVLGKILYQLWHRPYGTMRQSLQHGGPWAERETGRQRREMEIAAATLPPLPEFPGTKPITLHLMTGRRFWYQTAFCLHSFARSAGTTLHAVIYDDGSIDATTAHLLTRLGPGVTIRFQSELRAQLDRLLPAARFPVLRERWENYPNIRKLIDVHLGSTGWKLVIDSDLLFFRRPDLLLAWAATPDRPLHAVDCEESYGYSRPLLAKLAGAPIPSLVNVGLCGLRSEALDWAELEAWTAELQAKEKTSYYLEQALVAIITARQPCTVAPAADYVTLPTRAEVLTPRAVMHHYVAHAKRWYFRHGWRHFVASAQP
ncbi:MAG: glycosyl transferase [Undibacterium sp.]|nr:glycosyl transferase [Opitutaceae bacterium]